MTLSSPKTHSGILYPDARGERIRHWALLPWFRSWRKWEEICYIFPNVPMNLGVPLFDIPTQHPHRFPINEAGESGQDGESLSVQSELRELERPDGKPRPCVASPMSHRSICKLQLLNVWPRPIA